MYVRTYVRTHVRASVCRESGAREWATYMTDTRCLLLLLSRTIIHHNKNFLAESHTWLRATIGDLLRYHMDLAHGQRTCGGYELSQRSQGQLDVSITRPNLASHQGSPVGITDIRTRATSPAHLVRRRHESLRRTLILTNLASYVGCLPSP